MSSGASCGIRSTLRSGLSRRTLVAKLTEQLNDAFIVGNGRNEQQEIEFPINQLLEVALRALSPAVNDPFTAIRCIDRLGAGLFRLAQQEFSSPLPL